MIFTLDALHCQKKLLEQIILNCNVSTALSTDETVEQNRGRNETRRVWVYDELYALIRQSGLVSNNL